MKQTHTKPKMISADEWFAMHGLTTDSNRYQYLKRVHDKERDPMTGNWLVLASAPDPRVKGKKVPT